MEYQKIVNLIDDASDQPSKYRPKIGLTSRGAYNINSRTKFKTTFLKSNLCDYSDAYILVKGTIVVNNIAAADTDANNANKNCASFTNYMSEKNNRQVGNTKDIDIVMPMYNLTEYSNNYSKASGSL